MPVTTVTITINGEVIYSMTRDEDANTTEMPDALARPITQHELWCLMWATEWMQHYAMTTKVAPGGPHVRTIKVDDVGDQQVIEVPKPDLPN